MVSRTKYQIGDSKIRALFRAAGLGEIKEITPLGEGEYNAVFSAMPKKTNAAAPNGYVLKIAPPDNTPVMTLETDMMAVELFWYEKIREHTQIPVPKVYYSDFSRTIIAAPYFIMEKLNGPTLDKLPKERQADAVKQIAQMAGMIHKIKGEWFGYVQNGLYETWYEAIHAMTEAVLNDGFAAGKRSARGSRLLGKIEQHKAVLEKAECRMVNYDLWMTNVVLLGGANNAPEVEQKYAWIDPERSFWGDPVMDCVCLEPMTPLENKTISLEAHNSVSDVQISATPEMKIRYGVALGYLALIMETEKYYRYTRTHRGWWRNVFASRMMYRHAFRLLK